VWAWMAKAIRSATAARGWNHEAMVSLPGVSMDGFENGQNRGW
jgi:hypothetical protein